MSRFYEDFTVDEVFTSRGRTITEAEIVLFAALTGDNVELHTNAEYARESPYGQRIAPGSLVFSVATGLMTQMGLINETVLAFYGVDRLRFTAPVFIGDTLRVVKRVLEMQERDAARGIVTFESTVLNQRGEPVSVYRDKLLLKRRV